MADSKKLKAAMEYILNGDTIMTAAQLQDFLRSMIEKLYEATSVSRIAAAYLDDPRPNEEIEPMLGDVATAIRASATLTNDVINRLQEYADELREELDAAAPAAIAKREVSRG